MSQQQPPSFNRDGSTQPTPVVYPPTQQLPPTMPVKPSPQPGYAPPQFYQQPPRKPRHRLDTMYPLTVIAVLALFFGVCVFALVKVSSSSSTDATPDLTVTTGSSQAMQDAQGLATANALSTEDAQFAETPLATAPPDTPTPTTPPNPHGDIGVSQQSGIWAISVDGITTSQGEDYIQPKAGDVFVIVNVTAKNTDSATQTISEIDFTLRSSDGTTYSYAFLSNVPAISGDVLSGQQIKGGEVFEVPASVHDFVFQFNADFDPNDTVQWNLSV